MITQYPHTITVITGEETEQDDNGDFESSEGSSTDLVGRYEPNSGSGYVVSEDKVKIDFTGVIYLPLPANIEVGSKVDVKLDDSVIAKGEVVKFSEGQLNARAWLV